MAISGTFRRKSRTTRRNIPLEEYQAQKSRKKRSSNLQKGQFSMAFPKGKTLLMYSAIALGVFFGVALSSGYQHQIPVRNVQFHLHAESENRFLDQDDLRMLTEMEFGRDLVGAKIEEVNLRDLEAGISAIPFIQKAEVYKTFTGVVHIETWFRTPIARMVSNNGNHIYLDEKGNKFPISAKQATNVLLIRGNIEEKLLPADSLKQDHIQEALPLLNYIRKHDFWNAQLSELIVGENGDISFTPLAGSMRIEFGKPDRIEEKFQHLRLFYNQVLGQGAWDQYKKVSVKYKGQVVATPK